MTTGEKVALALLGVVAGGVTIALIARRRKPAGQLGAVPEAADRIGTLQDAVWDAVRNPQMRELALAVTGYGTRNVDVGRLHFDVTGAGCPPRDGECESSAIGDWVAAHQAQASKMTPAGIDSSAALACSLLSLNGVTCRFRAARQGKELAVYALAGVPKNRPMRWLAMDYRGQYRFGLESARAEFEDFDG